jgi:hypothetical protein
MTPLWEQRLDRCFDALLSVAIVLLLAMFASVPLLIGLWALTEAL